jgi:hypothetical protein
MQGRRGVGVGSGNGDDDGDGDGVPVGKGVKVETGSGGCVDLKTGGSGAAAGAQPAKSRTAENDIIKIKKRIFFMMVFF